MTPGSNMAAYISGEIATELTSEKPIWCDLNRNSLNINVKSFLLIAFSSGLHFCVQTLKKWTQLIKLAVSSLYENISFLCLKHSELDKNSKIQLFQEVYGAKLFFALWANLEKQRHFFLPLVSESAVIQIQFFKYSGRSCVNVNNQRIKVFLFLSYFSFSIIDW